MAEHEPGPIPAHVVARLRQRHALTRGTRAFFERLQFVEVETPALVPSPGLDFHLDAFEVHPSRAPRFLSTSPEYQMKRLLASGMERIFQLCRAYRRDEDGAHHQPEFTMLEWYRAHADAEAVMRDTEQLFSELAASLHGRPAIQRGSRTIDLAPPWPRLTVAQAFEQLAGLDVWSVLPDEERFFRVLVDQIEPHLGKDRPVFLTHYPAAMASLARLTPDDPRYAERFEAYVDGIELCNGFGELTDPVEQRRRLEHDQALRRSARKPVYPIDERLLAALESGMPASGGNALGFDRMVMLLLGATSVSEVMAFPSARL